MVENKASLISTPNDGRSDAFLKSVTMLLKMNLGSLAINCPVCGGKGLAMTKWIKGRKIKPLYVFHGDGSGTAKECCVAEDDAKEIRGHTELSTVDLRKLLKRTKAYALFSGGLDSLSLLLHLLEIVGNNGSKPTALHIDTTAGFPEVTKYVRKVCRMLNVPLEIVKPRRDYFELAKRWGIPSFGARWCCHELKVKPVRDFLSTVPGQKIVLDGIRAAESYQRSSYLPVWFHPAFQCLSVSPILGWSDGTVRSYVEESGLPEGPARDLGCSAECWCGAYKTRSDFEKLLEVHPEIFQKLVEVEKAQRGRFTFVYESGRRVPLSDLKKSRRQHRNSKE